jgi:hypothetical protein
MIVSLIPDTSVIASLLRPAAARTMQQRAGTRREP